MQISKDTFKKLLILITFTAALLAIISNFSFVWQCICVLFSVTFPIYLGLFLAFIINLPMKKYEKLFSRGKGKVVKAIKRPISLLLSILSILAVFVLVVVLIVPELINAFSVLVDYVPKAAAIITEWFNKYDLPFGDIVNYIKNLDVDWIGIAQQALGVASGAVGDILSVSVSFIIDLVGGVINFFMAVIISIYVVLTKDKLKLQTHKLIKAYLPNKIASYVVHVVHVVKTTFSKYIVGQCTEALILGTLCVIGMSILRLPYAPMIGAMMSVLALIPIVGLAIAVTLGSFMILMVNPLQAIIFLLFYFALQQVEGNLIYPRVVGSSIGLDPLWVLSAILVGGGLFGIVGLFFAVPTVSVAFKLISENCNKRLAKKNL